MILTDKFDRRPWPVPDGPHLMELTWNNILLLHRPIEKGRLVDLIPQGLELQTYDGAAWISIVALHMTGVHMKGMPSVPFASEFLQLNVRTYVQAGYKPGIFIFSSDVSNPLVMVAEKQLFHVPSHFAEMTHQSDAGLNLFSSKRYESGGSSAEFSVSYGPVSPVYAAEKGSLDQWLVERYCQYAVGPQGKLYRSEIHHFPWPLQRADALTGENNLALPNGSEFPKKGVTLCHFAHRLDVMLWGAHEVNLL